jgi:hypothetical protein
VQTNEGIQNQEFGFDRRHCGAQAFAILWKIKQKSRGRDHIEREILQPCLGGGTDPFHPLAYHAQRILGGVDQNRPGAPDREPAQTVFSGRDANREIQGQETLAAFGFAAQDPNSLLAPEAFHKPRGFARCVF